jgi:hypothetical protein
LNLIPPEGSLSGTEIGSRTTKPRPVESGQPIWDKASEGVVFASGLESLDGSIFEDSRSTDDHQNQNQAKSNRESNYFLRSPPQLFPVSTQDQRIPQPCKATRDNELGSLSQRPLPVLPDNEARSRRLSSDSHAPSITASLLQYIEEDSFSNDDIEVGVANLAQVKSGIENVTLTSRPISPKSPQGDTSSNYERSSSSDFTSPEKLPRHHYLATSGSILENELALFSPSPEHDKLACTMKTLESSCRVTKPGSSRRQVSTGVMGLTESEWMKGNHSPLSPSTGFF